MCRLKIKIRVLGKHPQRFLRFVLVPKNLKQRGGYILKLGSWDVRSQPLKRYIIFDILKILYYCYRGATINPKILDLIYKYFIDLRGFDNWSYFNRKQISYMVEDEIKKKYL